MESSIKKIYSEDSNSDFEPNKQIPIAKYLEALKTSELFSLKNLRIINVKIKPVNRFLIDKYCRCGSSEIIVKKVQIYTPIIYDQEAYITKTTFSCKSCKKSSNKLEDLIG
ncbi:MAG: hypothetical protein ACOYT4_00040 [Nanoarchaeota archaeon]